ncbi:MAG: antibiotic biosynthesis monooxygenase family protein [Chloroflexota bacterium]
MYMTILRYRVREGQEEALREHNEEWKRTIRPKATGFISSYVYRSRVEAREWTNIATFVDRDAEMENANNVDHRLWYRHMLEMVEAKPVVWEGELIQEG